MAQLQFVLRECPMHGAACTVMAFTSIDNAVMQAVHLDDETVRAIHARLGQRVLSLDVPRIAKPSDFA